MPLFEYFCTDCQAKFEVLTSYSASQEAMVCATCHGTRVRKLFPMVARRSKSNGNFADGYDGYSSDDFADESGELGSGGCSCGGACSCNN